MNKNKNLTLKSTYNKEVSESNAQFDPWIILLTFRRCWLWALPTGTVLAGIAVFLAINTFVPSYRADHILESNQDFVVFRDVMPIVRDLAKTERALILNPIVLDPVLTDPDVANVPSLSNPETAPINLLRNISISSGGNESRLVISYEDFDKNAAADVCNAIAESYLRQRNIFDNARVSNLVRLLEPEIKRWEAKVKGHRGTVQKLSKQTLGVTSGPFPQIENADKLAIAARLRSDLSELSVEILVKEAELSIDAEREKKHIAATEMGASDILIERIEPTVLQIDAEVRNDQNVVKAKALIERYQSSARQLEDQNRVGLRREDYKRFKAKAAQWSKHLVTAEADARVLAKKKLKEIADSDYERRKARAVFAAQNASKQSQLEKSSEFIQKEEQIDLLKGKQAVLQGQYDQERKRLEKFGGATAELQFAQEELSISNDVLNRLRGRVAAIRTERRQDGAVRSLAPATPPRSPIEELPYKKMAMMGGVAMLIPFMLGLLFEVRAKRLTDSTMCDKNGLSVIGEIAQIPSNIKPGKVDRVFEESVDTLRASLFLSEKTQNTRSIAVVSSMSGEGKSSVSSQLALSIAKATGETVLLVDGDLRCPDQHSIFGLELGDGLSGVLSGKTTLHQAIDKSLGDLIHVLPAGSLSSSPHRLISTSSIREFIHDATESYDYVVFDTSPVLSAGETLTIASVVDSTLLCVLRDVSRMDNVNRAIRRLEAAGASLAGTVFSGVSARQYAYRYGDYRYSVSNESHTPSLN